MQMRTSCLLASYHVTFTFPVQDGQIDYGEFAAMMRKGNGGVGRRTMRKTLKLGEALGVHQSKE